MLTNLIRAVYLYRACSSSKSDKSTSKMMLGRGSPRAARASKDESGVGGEHPAMLLHRKVIKPLQGRLLCLWAYEERVYCKVAPCLAQESSTAIRLGETATSHRGFRQITTSGVFPQP